MKIKYGSFDEKKGTVVAWHEDTTKKGNYVLTVRTPMGRIISAIEKELSSEQVQELKENVPKDGTQIQFPSIQ
ncbi:hypothetical protein [Atopococcus tabaci]|uniref:hypothetical protein n=1 Tax=Atopococcus tabaci TaxID=269774 RepID=UPI0003FD1BD7|nr:hypothetical protein [Atopococcus tabaci]